MAGKLFVIDGVDGSGKNTQAMELYLRFLTEGYTADEDITMVPQELVKSSYLRSS